jgi:predicted phosphohydrolase
MKIFSISDLHLSINNPKPMNIFGPAWDNYIDTITKDWKEKVGEEDVVLIAGDISWAMKFEDAKPDIDLISNLPGKKIMIRGNHDYWWKSISAVRNLLDENFFALQNDHVKIGEYIFCGTRGWQVPEKSQSKEDEKIYKRETLRLQLSLESAKKEQEKNPGSKIICLIHYPPFNSRYQKAISQDYLSQYKVHAIV